AVRVGAAGARQDGCRPALIVRIARTADWERAQGERSYVPPSFGRDGFIHMSRPDQVQLPANAFFTNQADLVLLWIDESRLGGNLRYEAADEDGEKFPHLYAPLDLEAVVGVTGLERWEPGGFVLPPRPR